MALKEKNPFWQTVRGLCILSVILIHCANGTQYPPASLSFNFWIVERCLIDFPVAVFIFMSGYFVNSAGGFLGKRIKRLLIPYLLWSLFYALLRILPMIVQSQPIDVFDLITDICTGKISTQMYYIIALLQLVLITPLVLKFCDNKIFNAFAWLLTPVYLIIIYIFVYFGKADFPYRETLFPAWFLFYYMGIKIKRRLKTIKLCFRVKPAVKIILIAAAVILSVLESYIMLSSGVNAAYASSQIRLSSFVYVGVLIIIMSERSLRTVSKPGIVTRALAYFGDMSFGIFFVHSFYLTVISRVLQYAKINITVLPLLQIVQFGFCLFASWITIILIRKIFGKKIPEKYLGM